MFENKIEQVKEEARKQEAYEDNPMKEEDHKHHNQQYACCG